MEAPVEEVQSSGPTLGDIVAHYLSIFGQLFETEVSFEDGNFMNDGKIIANLTELFKIKDDVCSTLNSDEIIELVKSKIQE